MTFLDAIHQLISNRTIPSKIDPENLAKILEKQFGKLVDGYLGSGQYGHAWRIGKNRVLKLTGDKDEAYAASILKRQHHPNVANYEHVAQLGNLPIYVIIQEYGGRPIEDVNIRETLDNLPGGIDSIIKDLKSQTEYSTHPIWPQLLAGIQHIRDAGINFFDIHSDNVVEQNGIYKIIDVGVGNPEQMHLAKLQLERKLQLAFNIEVIDFE